MTARRVGGVSITHAHDKMSINLYDMRMDQHALFEWPSSGWTRTLRCLVVLLCICVVTQMLGVPATFMDLLSSDALVKSEPVSEDHTTVSPSAEPERPRLLTLVTESDSVLRLPILTTSVFHPPAI